MQKITHWLSTHKFEAHSLAFALMIIPSLLIVLSIQQPIGILNYLLLGLIILGNLLVLSTE